MDEKQTGTYVVNVKCTNCDHCGTVTLPKGRPAPGSTLGGHPAVCPVCGCRALCKAFPNHNYRLS